MLWRLPNRLARDYIPGALYLSLSTVCFQSEGSIKIDGYVSLMGALGWTTSLEVVKNDSGSAGQA